MCNRNIIFGHKFLYEKFKNCSVAVVDPSDKVHPQLVENVQVVEGTPTLLPDIVMDNATSTATQELSDTISKMFKW